MIVMRKKTKFIVYIVFVVYRRFFICYENRTAPSSRSTGYRSSDEDTLHSIRELTSSVAVQTTPAR